MKCKFCDGSGKDYWGRNGEPYPCPVCNGTGEYEHFDLDVELDKLYPTEPTNEEWRKTCSEEEFAEALTKVVLDIVSWNNDPKPSEVRHILKSWLKQPHEGD